MSKQAAEFQKKEMSKMYRGKEIFKPLNTGWVDERVACVREWVANIFFYRKGDTTIMIDAGYNYDRLAEKMDWLGIDPQSIRHILITHQDTDHVGAVEADSPGLFRSAKLYIGEIENRYLTGEVRRKVIYHLYKLPQVAINNEKVLLREIGRLESSLKAAGEHEKLVFLHYPPLYQGYRCPEILRLLKEYGVKLCCYGHLHGASHRRAIEGMWDGTEFSLVSADYLKFVPKKICE